MKTLYLALVCSFAFFSSCKQAPKNISTKSEKAEIEMPTNSACITLTQDEFQVKVADFRNQTQEWKYLGDKPAIIDFYASWCKPCKELSPILEEIAAEYKDRIYIYKVDIDKNKELTTAFNVQAVPTLFFIPMEGNPSIAKGGMTKEQLQKHIDEVLLKASSSM